MIKNISAFAKFLDQPILISKLNKQMPKILALTGVFCLSYDIFEKKHKQNFNNKEKKESFKKAIILSTSILSALLAPKIASKITKRKPLENLYSIQKENTKIINKYIKEKNPDKQLLQILDKAKNTILNPKEIKILQEKTKTHNIFEQLIPSPKNIEAKEIFSEIGYLSIYGAVPVIGGIGGGILADKITKDDYKKNITNKINEGLYQYLANIFMCNIGAGGALAILEKLNVKSKSVRAMGMTTGIILTGVVGGSKIANFIAKNIVNPIISPNEKPKERKPEAIDLCLHTDDIATVSLLSGLKWIEPVLPALYTISGYKAGIGYRN